LEAGPGLSFEPSVSHRSAFAVMLDFGGAVRVRDRVRLSLELSRTSSILGFGSDASAAEGSPGERILTTTLLGVEIHDLGGRLGTFSSVGIGYGHASLSGATERDPSSPNGFKDVPPSDRSGLGIGVMFGVRTRRPAYAGVRFHMVTDLSAVPAFGLAAVLGVDFL
jgi:hypothetical protein